ncbi:MAG TPA: DedA family protein, partial [Streptosporangiales bacterium]
MTDAIMQALRDTMASPWVYAALFLLAWLDGFLPAFPSESAVIVAGVFAAHGAPSVPLLVLYAALGAFAGDHTSYLVGRLAGGRLVRRLARAGTRRAAAVRWADRALVRRGGLILVVARYVPGGRTTVTLTAGTVAMPLRRFTPYAALAAASWGLYGTLVGYFGGVAFEDDPFRGVLFGLGVALGVAAAAELTRLLRSRCRSRLVDQAGLVRHDRRLHPV